MIVVQTAVKIMNVKYEIGKSAIVGVICNKKEGE